MKSNSEVFNTSILFLDHKVNPNGRISKIFLLMVIEILAIAGNLLFLTAACCQRRSRSRTYIYFCFVSLTSLATTIFVIPFPIVSMVTKRWALGAELCYFNSFMTTFCLTSCIYSITVLSLHKYMSVVLPMKRQFSANQTYYQCVASFLLSLVITIIPFIESRVYFNPDTGLCGLFFLKRKTFYTLFVVIACYAFPTVTNILIYIQIFRALRKHGKRLQFNTFYNRETVTAQKQTVNTMYMTFGSYIIGWTPFFLYALLYLAETVKESNYLLVVAYFFGFTNSVANPMIFIFRNMRIRNSWSSIFRKKQMPKVKLISRVSRYAFPGSESEPSTVSKVGSGIGKEENRNPSYQNDYIELGSVNNNSLPGSAASDRGGINFLLRTSTNAFDYVNAVEPTKITFKMNETTLC